MTTVKALMELYVVLGGDADDFDGITIIPDAIIKIATLIASGATKELPTVTGSDDGKVLTVVTGAWAAAAIPAQLPAVTADDNGKVLKVTDGAWAVGTDATE